MGGTPVFSADERVDPPVGSLPTELQGKSAEEVAAYYQKKLKEQKPVVVPATPPRMPSNSEFWQDPRKASEEIARNVVAAGVTNNKEVTKQVFAEMAEPIKQNMIDMAEYLVGQEFPDWAKFAPQVKEAMQQIEPWARTQKHMWKTTYYYIKGVEASKPAVVPAAGVTPVVTPPGGTVIIPGGGPEVGRTPGGAPPSDVVTLNPDEQFVADHMGISAQQYKKAQKDIAEGNFPLTYDNRQRGGRR